MLSLILSRASWQEVLVTLLAGAFVVFCTMPVHEFAHAFAADKLGDPTARYNGRLTLNPLAHVDYIGALLIFLFGFGWAKPVPVNQRNFRKPKRDMAITGAAGPISNLLMALLLILLMYLLMLPLRAVSGTARTVLFYAVTFAASAAQINVTLAVFNLIPVPPLDGSRILFAILPDRLYYTIQQYERIIYYVVLALMVTGWISGPLSTASYTVFRWLTRLVGLPFSALGL